jgi:hypothetical protein
MDFFLFRAMRLPALILALFFAGQAAWAADLPRNAASAGPSGAAANAAADTDSAVQIANRAAIKAGATPVEVELEGTDALGAKLAFQFKELLNGGTLFLLTSQDTPKIRVLLATSPEFPSRPEVGSVYAALWLYYEKPTSFNSYLAREVGVISPGGVEDLAVRLAERTAGIAAKYAYIFEKH